MISHKNYIEYIIDYYDGKLSKADSDALMIFLNNNPELYEDFQVFGETVDDFEPEAMAKAPASLRTKLKNIPDEVVLLTDEMLVAYAENDLDAGTRQKMETALSRHSNKRDDLGLYKSLRFNPDEVVVFPYKNRLIKSQSFPICRMMYYSAAAAAVVLVALFLRPAQTPVTGVQSPAMALNRTYTNQPRNISPGTNNAASSQEPKAFQIVSTPENNTSSTDIYNASEEAIALLDPRTAEIIPTNRFDEPGFITEFSTEFIDIYNISMLKLSLKNGSENQNKSALNRWRNWGLGLITGSQTISDAPVPKISINDIADYGLATLDRFASENIPVYRKNK